MWFVIKSFGSSSHNNTYRVKVPVEKGPETFLTQTISQLL